MKWYYNKGHEGEIVISTRVRFARNLADYPFPGKMTAEQQRELIDKVSAVFAASECGADFRLVRMEDVSQAARRALVEKHIISPELENGENARAVLLSSDESVSIMINEEDHLRIQVMGTGLCYEEALRRAEEIDDIFAASLKVAFDENLGYLTKCPTNLGTGIRASVMLHLPALTESGAIRRIAASVGKLGFAVRGEYGEGSTARGALYQISNQMTLGFSEEQIVTRLGEVAGEIIEREKQARAAALKASVIAVEDRVWRAAGTLKHARSVSADEAMRLLGDIRIGGSLGILDYTPDKLNGIMWEMQPANLMLITNSENLTPQQRDAKRADLLRDRLKDIRI